MTTLDINNYINNELKLNCEINKKELYEKLIELYQKEKVDFAMYNKFEFLITNTEEKIKRKYQDSFRDDLINRYGGCIITGVPEILCEACHIIPYCECEDKDKYNVDNGLLLRSDLHKLFDKKMLKINPKTCEIILSSKILSEPKFKEYHMLHNKKINIHKNSLRYLNVVN